MSTPEEYFALSQKAKEAADGVQVHKPAHASLMAAAQVYASWAVYAELRQQRHREE